jgi:hypothetical protein
MTASADKLPFWYFVDPLLDIMATPAFLIVMLYLESEIFFT